MKIIFGIALIGTVLALIWFNLGLKGNGAAEMELKKTDTKILTLYDNYEQSPALKTGWGFSCLVDTGEEILLFDTGGDSDTLLFNMERLNVDPGKITSVFLSHEHYDHTGGLAGILKMNSDVKVYVPEPFGDSLKRDINSYGSEVVEVKEPVKISGGMFSSGEMGTGTKEQSLIVKTGKGLVVITGCAHPGIVSIVEEAKRLAGEDVYLVMGGFHLFGESEPELRGIIGRFRELGVRQVAPSHCSGEKARKLFEEEYKKDFIKNGAGGLIEV